MRKSDGPLADMAHRDAPVADAAPNPEARRLDAVPADMLRLDQRVTPPDAPCAAGLLFCGGACVNASTDNNNCGGCGMACASGYVCASGMCMKTCLLPLQLCSGACVDTTTSPSNCGTCGNVCATGTSCMNGVCCAAGQTNCGGACVSTSTNSANCGACGVACAAGQSCVGGLCCPTGDLNCGGACVNPQSDNSNCGACGTVCSAGRVCNMGACATLCMKTLCASGACVDLSSDPSNCGSCGTTCAAGQSCLATGGSPTGICCASGDIVCGGACVNPMTDSSHCGTCGNACGAGTYCSGGTCASCSAPSTVCGSTCTNLQTDSANCGACGAVCAAGTTCQKGICCAAGLTACGGACVSTATNSSNCGACGNACTGGEVCSAGVCQCPSGTTLCSGVCVNLSSSGTNCGACGVACATGASCMATGGTPPGVCCAAGDIVCGGKCVNPKTDSSNCNGCGIACTGGQSCNAGSCTCPGQETLCGGTCTLTATDPKNCGSCGTVCPATAPSCVSNGCVATCPAGMTACNGTCVTTSTDIDNCGTCGLKCPSGTGCSGGSCVMDVPLSGAPAACSPFPGPTLDFSTGSTSGSSTSCAGNVAATAFTFALCSCKQIGDPNLGGSQTFDAYDSSKGPYTTGQPGAGVACNGPVNFGSSDNISGDLWSSYSGGVTTKSCTVQQRVHVSSMGSSGTAQGQLSSTSGGFTAMGNGYVIGPFANATIDGALYTPACPASGVAYGSCVATPATAPTLDFPPPCACNPPGSATNAEIPVVSYVNYYSMPVNNDDAAIGLSPSTFDGTGSPPNLLDLPCGHYYLDRIVDSAGLTIAAHGNTALFVGGSMDVTGSLTITVDSGATLDIFVKQDVWDSGTLVLGSQASPRSLRLYIGGECAGLSASGQACSTNGDCCSDSCAGGVCTTGNAVSTSFPWSMAMKASVNIGAEIYAPAGEIYSKASFIAYGAFFAGVFQTAASMTIHYDKGVVGESSYCPPPTTGTSCASCADCANQACIGGVCTACVTDSDCCAPLRCVGGTCTFGIGF